MWHILLLEPAAVKSLLQHRKQVQARSLRLHEICAKLLSGLKRARATVVRGRRAASVLSSTGTVFVRFFPKFRQIGSFRSDFAGTIEFNDERSLSQCSRNNVKRMFLRYTPPSQASRGPSDNHKNRIVPKPPVQLGMTGMVQEPRAMSADNTVPAPRRPRTDASHNQRRATSEHRGRQGAAETTPQRTRVLDPKQIRSVVRNQIVAIAES